MINKIISYLKKCIFLNVNIGNQKIFVSNRKEK